MEKRSDTNRWLKRSEAIKHFFNLFIPPNKRDCHQRLNRAHMLVGVLVANLVVTAFSAACVQWLLALDEKNYQLAMGAIAWVALIYLIALALFRFGSAHMLAGNLVLVGLTSVIGFTVPITGGYQESPLFAFFTILPLMAFLLMGLKAGLAWGLIALGMESFYVIAPHFNFTTIQNLSDTDLNHFRMGLPMLICVMVTCTLAIYELLNESLKQQLNDERNQFAYHASHDPLTGLPNRAEFDLCLNYIHHQAKQFDQGFALIYIDLNGFKPINDELGHHAGDQVLITIGQRLGQQIRKIDTAARLGGDEFALLLQGIHNKTDVDSLLRVLNERIETPISLDNQDVSVSASMGIALYPTDGKDPLKLQQAADEAMYQAKRNGSGWAFVSAPEPSEQKA